MRKLIVLLTSVVLMMSLSGCSVFLHGMMSEDSSSGLSSDASEPEESSQEESSEQSESQESEESTATTIAPEDMKGRGNSDSGRSEPNYVGIEGYAAIYGSEQDAIERSSDFADIAWEVPIFDKDKNEIGKIPHKTPVLVLEQNLEHGGWGSYGGFLTVKRLDTSEEVLLHVSNFITTPYWDYDDIEESAKKGICIAEYHQVSDYSPSNDYLGKDAVEVDDGAIVLIAGYNGFSEGNHVEAIVYQQWKKGFGGAKVYFCADDLTIIY